MTRCADDHRILDCGSRVDYRALRRFHYRAGDPAAVTDIFVIRDLRPTAVGAWCGHRQTREPVGVLTRSMPVLNARLRDLATGHRYRGLAPAARARAVNRDCRMISRVIVDPRYRGRGLGVALVRHVLAHPASRFTEAFSVMGHLHPLFDRAGMRRYERPLLPAHERIVDAFREHDLPLRWLACTSRIEQALAFRPRARSALTGALRRALADAGHRSRPPLRELGLAALLERARRHVPRPPLYYFADHHAGVDVGSSASAPVVSALQTT